MNAFANTQNAPSPANSNGTHTPVGLAVVKRSVARLRRIEPYGQSALLLALRLVYGWFFVQTGWGKLVNFERTAGFFQGLGLPAPTFLAGLVAVTELVGGILLFVGAQARYAAFALSVVMLVAFATAHADEAWQSLSAFTGQAPYPFLVATLVVLGFGAGHLSLDGWLRARAARRRYDSAAETAD
jgi:putative oxidoreductase